MSSEAPLYRQVEQHLEALIRRRGLQPGESIPSHSALADELGVNHLTVRRGVQELIRRRVLVSQQGRGTFVAEGIRPRVLWVCGVDVFSGDVSAHYTDHLRLASASLREHELAVQPVWLPSNQALGSTPYASEQVLNEYAAYMFIGCDEQHELLCSVARSSLPFVDCSDTDHYRPNCVTPHKEQARRLALEQLSERGHRRATVMALHGRAAWTRRVALDLDVVACGSGRNRRSEVERVAYARMVELLESDRLRDALLITDDVVACGATRALHERGAARQRELDIVVVCSIEQMVPLGLPVTYVAFDNREQVGRAVGVLVDQLQGRATLPVFHQCPYEVYRPGEFPPPREEPAGAQPRPMAPAV